MAIPVVMAMAAGKDPPHEPQDAIRGRPTRESACPLPTQPRAARRTSTWGSAVWRLMRHLLRFAASGPVLEWRIGHA